MAKDNSKTLLDGSDRLQRIAFWYWEYMRRNPLYQRYCAVIETYNDYFKGIGIYEFMQTREFLDEMTEYVSSHNDEEDLKYTPFRRRLEESHVFGMTTPKLIRHIPVYSCDSKTWLDYGSRGRVLYWNPENPGLDKTDILYFPKRQNPHSSGPGVYYHDYPYLEPFKEYIGGKLHLEIGHLLGLGHDKYRELVNVLYFLELEKMITEEQRQEGIVFD